MRLIARFCIQNKDAFEIVTIFDSQIQKEYLNIDHPTLKTVAHTYPTAVWFERKMHDDFGITIEDAFDNRPLIQQERAPRIHPMRKEFDAKSLTFAPFQPYKYETIEGESVFEVPVGPIHAGIIEPGHFHFTQSGEGMLHLEVRHFYKYRGIEKMLEGKTPLQAAPVIARISGNESIAYQTGWFRLLLEASGRTYPLSLQRYHALLLELERVIHHFTDLGFIPNDAGFAAALAFASQRAEACRRLMAKLTGHRFGFDAVGFSTRPYSKAEVSEFVMQMREHLKWFEAWISDIPSLWDRFDTTGILTHPKALKYGTVGVMARASGVAIDRRTEPFYQTHRFQLQTAQSGDVSARFTLRIEEIKNSLQMIEACLDESETSPLPNTEELRDGDYVSFTESSLGELMLFIRLREGKIDRFFARDPSFVNWQALTLMMPGNIIADFPLINKSCDLSYAGNDL